MTDMLRQGQRWLSDKLTKHATCEVIYRRGDVDVFLRATIGQSTYQQDDGEGTIIRSQVRDFLINTDDLLRSVIGSLPRRGDQIIEEKETVAVYEVMSLGSDPPWRYSDPFRLKLRIHTKQVETNS